MDEWEDVVEISTIVNQVAILVTKFPGDRKYSRDVFLTIKDQYKDIQFHFDYPYSIELLDNF